MRLKGSEIPNTLEGRVVAVTGCSAGIGIPTALDMSKRGARVLMLCRNLEKATPVMEKIKAETNNEVIIYKLDLSSLDSVRECAKAINETEEKLDILINNAGVMHTEESWKTKEGYDMQFGTNHLGHFLLTELLMPLIRKAAETGFKPRIVNVSSLAHEWGQIYWDDINFEKGNYNKYYAYNQSKLANVMHAKSLARRLQGTGIDAFSLHPGCSDQHLLRPCAVEPSLEGKSGAYFSDCKEKRAQRKALIEADQDRLWEISKKMTGLKSDE